MNSVFDKLKGRDMKTVPIAELRLIRTELEADIIEREKLIDVEIDIVAVQRDNHKLLSQIIATRHDMEASNGKDK